MFIVSGFDGFVFLVTCLQLSGLAVNADVLIIPTDFNFDSIVYAGDLNLYKSFLNSTGDDCIFADLRAMQSALHSWGDRNFVKFDAAKESIHILSKHKAVGDDFRILGCIFDCKLTMSSCIHEMVVSANWKIRMLLRIRRFYSVAELINLYKSHVLSYLEYKTGAILHAGYTTLLPLDLVQSRFLRELGLCIEDAANYFRLLPLRLRRQIAALKVIHRVSLKRGSKQL